MVRYVRIRRGRDWPGEARQGQARATDGGTEGSSLPAILMDGHGATRSALASYGMARRSRVWRGLATADDLSTEPFGALCWVL